MKAWEWVQSQKTRIEWLSSFSGQISLVLSIIILGVNCWQIHEKAKLLEELRHIKTQVQVMQAVLKGQE